MNNIKMYYHKIFPELISVRDCVGEVNVSQCIESLDKMRKSSLIGSKTAGVMTNLISCIPELDFENFDKLIDYLKSTAEYRNLRHAIICHDPKLIVYPVWAEFTEEDVKMKAFTTEREAIKWILQNNNIK